MKKTSGFTVIAIIGAVLIVLGLIVGVVGFAMGGRVQWDNVSWNWHDNNWYWGWGSNGSNSWSNLTDYNLTLEEEAVTALDLELYAGKLEIVVAQQGGYDIRNYPADALNISFEDGVLSIKDPHDYHGGISASQYKNTTITVYITQDHLDYLDIEMGVGEFVFRDCSVGDFSQEMGVAESTLTNIRATHYEVDGGVGSLRYINCDFSNASFSTGTGELVFDGKLSGACSVEGAVGSISLTLRGTLDDYYFVCSQGVGEIRIGDNVIGGLGNGDFSLGNAASANRIEIESGVGSVAVSFSGN